MPTQNTSAAKVYTARRPLWVKTVTGRRHRRSLTWNVHNVTQRRRSTGAGHAEDDARGRRELETCSGKCALTELGRDSIHCGSWWPDSSGDRPCRGSASQLASREPLVDFTRHLMSSQRHDVIMMGLTPTTVTAVLQYRPVSASNCYSIATTSNSLLLASLINHYNQSSTTLSCL